jgi:pimeloyl-ACP methyl ester carboxylesterase
MSRREIVSGPSGSTFAVDRAGTGDAVVVWLHSEFGAFSDPPVPADALEGGQVLTLHLPGWGISERGEARINTLPELALALWFVLDELGVGTVTLAGHGIGATIALEMAIQQPQRAHTVVAAAPFGIVDAGDPGVDMFALLTTDLLPHLYADSEGGLVKEHFPRPADPHERGLAAIRRVEVLGEAGRYLFPLPDTGIEDRLYRLAGTDVRLLWGEHDGVVPIAISERWTAALPSATSSVVPGSSHMLVYETSVVGDVVSGLLGPAVVSG